MMEFLSNSLFVFIVFHSSVHIKYKVAHLPHPVGNFKICYIYIVHFYTDKTHLSKYNFHEIHPLSLGSRNLYTVLQ